MKYGEGDYSLRLLKDKIIMAQKLKFIENIASYENDRMVTSVVYQYKPEFEIKYDEVFGDYQFDDEMIRMITTLVNDGFIIYNPVENTMIISDEALVNRLWGMVVVEYVSHLKSIYTDTMSADELEDLKTIISINLLGR